MRALATARRGRNARPLRHHLSADCPNAASATHAQASDLKSHGLCTAVSAADLRRRAQINMGDALILEISIPSSRLQRGHTEYQIDLITNNEHFERNYIRVFRRYSEFLRLHKKIKHRIPALPEFPKKILLLRFKESIVESRRVHFEIYARYICQFVIRNGFEHESFGRAILDFFSSK